MHMTKIKATIQIEATPDTVWQTVKNIGNIADFHPLVKHSHTTNQVVGIGAERHCTLKPMGKMQEKSMITTEVIGGQCLPPYQLMIGDLRLTEKGQRTEVSFTFSYRLKWGWLGDIMNVVLFKSQFKKGPTQYVKGLKDYIESHSVNRR